MFVLGMARAFLFNYVDDELAAEMRKVDRSKRYGAVQVETLDE